MSHISQYQKYLIKSFPQPTRDDRWTINISIIWDEAGMTTLKPFTAESVYQTEAEADLHGITFGQRIIDGKVPGLSIN